MRLLSALSPAHFHQHRPCCKKLREKDAQGKSAVICRGIFQSCGRLRGMPGVRGEVSLSPGHSSSTQETKESLGWLSQDRELGIEIQGCSFNDRKLDCLKSSGRLASQACCHGRGTDGAKPVLPNMQMAAGRVAATFGKAARVKKGCQWTDLGSVRRYG